MRPALPHLLALVFCLPALWLGTGCRAVQTATSLPSEALRAVTPGAQGKPAADPVEVQQTLLRFADEVGSRVTLAIEDLRRGTNALDPAEALQRKLAVGTALCSIASGPNAVANLLDMTVFITVTRSALEEQWAPNLFGESAQPLLEALRQAEADIWRLAATVLNPAQQAELRTAIDAWRRLNPAPEGELAARAVGIASQLVTTTRTDAARPESVFSLLKLDPLSSLDPARREIAQMRLFAERALFVSQKMPTLLRWQTELLSLNTLRQPTVQQLVTNSTELTAAVERFATVAEQLPAQVSAEREAVLSALNTQEQQLQPLVRDVQQALAAGSQMATSLNTTLITFDALMKRFGVGEPASAGPPNTNAQPFRIQDYADTAAQLEAAARQLTELLRTFDQTLGSTNLAQLATQVSPAVEQAQTRGEALVNYAFRKGLLLLAAALAAALAYRYLRPLRGNA